MPSRDSKRPVSGMEVSNSDPQDGEGHSKGKLLFHHHRYNLRHRFELIRTLGEGTYGKVKLALEKATGEQVAIKYIKKTKIHDDQDLNRIRREIRILSSLRHPRIVNVREVFEKKDKIILVMDCALGGELYDYINDCKKLDEKEARRIFRQIVMAIHYCHEHGIVHRDLKLENIILDQQGDVKIADFGLANYFSSNKLLNTFCGSPLYASPEIVNGHPYHGPEVDMWSLGVVLYTLVYGAMPFDHTDLKLLRKQISSGTFLKPHRSSDAAPLIRHLLTVNPAKRAKMEDVLNHWWVNDGYYHTPHMEPYPSAAYVVDVAQVSHQRHQSCFSSDSESEFDSRLSRKTGIEIHKTSEENSFDEDEALFDIDRSKSPIEPFVEESKSSGEDTASETAGACADTLMDANTNSDLNTSGDESRKVFDSEKKPRRGILKRKGKFSGGDSGCIMLDDANQKLDDEETLTRRADTPTDLTFEPCDMDYDSAGATGMASHDAHTIMVTCSVHPEGNRSAHGALNGSSGEFHSNFVPSICICDNRQVVIPRRKGILKKSGVNLANDPRNRLSVGSTSSNSSADILDLSYDSGEGEQFLNNNFCGPDYSRHHDLDRYLPCSGPKSPSLSLANDFNALKIQSMDGAHQDTGLMFDQDVFDDDARQIIQRALEICKRVQ